MSIALGDLEELEAMSDFSDVSDSEEARSEHQYGTGSTTGSDFSGDSESSDDGGGGGDDDGKVRGSTPVSYENDGEGSAGSEESGESGESAGSSDDYSDEDRGNSSYSNEDDGDAVMSAFASSAQPDVRKQAVNQSIKGPDHINPAARDVSSDQAIQILSKRTFARSDADAEQLLEWVLSVRFFQENARSSFVRDSLFMRHRG